jgi:hypothetical protein
MRPDKPTPLYMDGGLLCLNLYKPPIHDAEPHLEAERDYLDFMAHLIPDPAHREYSFDMIGHHFQYPHIPGPSAVFFTKPKGTGGGTFIRINEQLFGSAYVAKIGRTQLAGGGRGQSAYTDYVAGSVLLQFDETSGNGSGKGSASNIMDADWLKELCDPAAFKLYIIRKTLPNYWATKFCRVWGMTNRPQGVLIEDDDRRVLVVPRTETPLVKNPELKARIDRHRPHGSDFTPEFIAGVARFYRTRDVSSFRPYDPPPFTDAKQVMVDLNRSVVSRIVNEVLDELPGDFVQIASLLNAVTNRIDANDIPKGQQLSSEITQAMTLTSWRALGDIKLRRPVVKVVRGVKTTKPTYTRRITFARDAEAEARFRAAGPDDRWTLLEESEVPLRNMDRNGGVTGENQTKQLQAEVAELQVKVAELLAGTGAVTGAEATAPGSAPGIKKRPH